MCVHKQMTQLLRTTLHSQVVSHSMLRVKSVHVQVVLGIKQLCILLNWREHATSAATSHMAHPQ